jgi:hypothetical protein
VIDAQPSKTLVLKTVHSSGIAIIPAAKQPAVDKVVSVPFNQYIPLAVKFAVQPLTLAKLIPSIVRLLHNWKALVPISLIVIADALVKPVKFVHP